MKTAGAWRMAAVLAVCLSSGSVAAKTFKCIDGAGHVTYSNFACPQLDKEPPVRPPAEPPCQLSTEQRRRAERLEEQFLLRFPSDETHRLATLGRLQPIIDRIRRAQDRLAEFTKERKTIDSEREFYKGKPLPISLSRRLDESEAKFAAMADLLKSVPNDIQTIMSQFQCEQSQFAVRWRGGPPGSSACESGCR
jgi:hypothetical protein